jgi:ABC-type multidrug transport system fused ATPase/permease subunit
MDDFFPAGSLIARRLHCSVAREAQGTQLFPGSISTNLSWLSGPQPDGEVWEALERADTMPFVQVLVAGLKCWCWMR